MTDAARDAAEVTCGQCGYKGPAFFDHDTVDPLIVRIECPACGQAYLLSTKEAP